MNSADVISLLEQLLGEEDTREAVEMVLEDMSDDGMIPDHTTVAEVDVQGDTLLVAFSNGSEFAIRVQRINPVQQVLR